MFRRQAKPVLDELAAMRAELEAAQAEQVGEKAADITMQRLWNKPEMSGSMTADVLAELERILGAAMTSVAAEFAKQGLRLSWDVFDREAQKWAASYGYNLIKQINESTQRQIGQAISSWIGKPAGFPELVEDIRRIMPAKAVQPGIRDRARLIAQTETTRVYAESRQAALASEGLERSRWRVAEDELVCEFCAPLGSANGGEGAIGVNGKFMDPVTGTQIGPPPRHVNCRCWIVPDTDELEARVQAQEETQPQGAAPNMAERITWAEVPPKLLDRYGYHMASSEQRAAFTRELGLLNPEVTDLWRGGDLYLVIGPNGAAHAQGRWIVVGEDLIGSPVASHEFVHRIVNQGHISQRLTEYKPGKLFDHALEMQNQQGGNILAALNEDLTIALDSFDPDADAWARKLSDPREGLGIDYDEAVRKVTNVRAFLARIR